MPRKRALSIWFPRLGAERLLRVIRAPDWSVPFAVLRDTGQMQVISSLNLAGSQAGLRVGQPLRDALAMCPGLATRLHNTQAEATFLAALRRWATRFSPWVAEQGVDALMLDITGCAHLFGGEEALTARIQDDCARHGLSVRCGLADTPGAAWALARFAGDAPGHSRSGDAIDQEARATRARAVKRRHWERGGTAPLRDAVTIPRPAIAAPGQTRTALAPLPVAALRLEPGTVDKLARLGLRRISDLAGQPRAALARRFGVGLVQRLDQALGAAPEPISPARADTALATRLTLPDPIGLEADILAALDRLLPRLCAMLRDRGLGVRLVRLQAFRADGSMGAIQAGLARPMREPDRIRPLLAMKLDELDAGFGIDMLRLEAVQAEPLHDIAHAGHAVAAQAARGRMAEGTALEDLIGRMGGRIGLEAITRRHPGDSHIPEKGAQVLAAAWSSAHDGLWPSPPAPRPLLMWRPEPVTAPDRPALPVQFRWRRRVYRVARARGPERIAPEWWLDDPDWRSGTRDYWDVVTEDGTRLWLFFAHGAALSRGWFCQGSFA
ncbi:DNA polymerase Y family protein [Lutimaribacter sp. EGI FJ00015]|uniref:DNA polymerase Y family protein n=1 Tax=Lutimaribacter degradans TaxID=2945989 RepID=A0ACC5ZUU0_9RHOB|nr:DNA polymerase Y family protein [Lutimaribacter sp. EGI FJ00013]MCM2561811.1 DNA polymerase Y family protein [Lutimaribacter sp. EGI FJ00013]MCO0613156.1 DNA polymerase Y family protein [Lutimaribacter sp. EGI FJ00015]MCO0635644.1 DNA polymerase Y family protein [Lutimaribacter sp. EGI FJ00014]